MKSITAFIFIAYFLCNNGVFAQKQLSLKECIRLTEQNNLELQVESKNIQINASEILSAKLRPNFILNYQTLQLLNQSQFAPGTNWYNFQNRQDWWQLTRIFQIPGQRKNKILVAQHQTQFTDREFANKKRIVLHEAALQWLECWKTSKSVEIMMNAVHIADSLKYINQLRWEKQMIAETEFIRTQLLQNQYQIQFIQIKQQLKNEIKKLALFMNIQDDFTIDTSSDFFELDKNTLDSIFQKVSTFRPDFQSASYQYEADKYNLKLQKINAIPQPELGVIWNPQNAIPYLGIYATIELPVFSRNQGEIQKAKIKLNQSQLNIDWTKKKISTELDIALSTYQTNQNLVNDARNMLEKANLILDKIKYSYLKGSTTIIDLLEAQRSWIETQTMFLEAEFNYKKSVIDLVFISGMYNQ